MKQYLVEFWYYTDLHCKKVVSAMNEMVALGKALEAIGEDTGWVTHPGFHVTVRFA